MKRVLGRPSPAMVIAVVALIAALGGTAIAGGFTTKKKVNKIINNRAPGLSVGSAKKADSAANVNGVVISRFFAQDAPNTPAHTIATVGGLTITGACTAGGLPELRAGLNETSNTMANTYGQGTFGTATLPAGATTLITGTVTFGGLGTADFVGYSSHKDYKIEWFVRDSGGSPLGDGSKCFYSGYVTST
jgi:hypothetical protein